MIERVRSQIWEPWELYERLKAYAKSPSQTERQKLTGLFNATFNRHGATCRMNKLLQNTLSRKKGLLQAPHVPLHNNDCERDIREYVKKRKISASTRSNSGPRARDTFLSLKKTCAKLGINFFSYLRDCVLGEWEIPHLAHRLVKLPRAGP